MKRVMFLVNILAVLVVGNTSAQAQIKQQEKGEIVVGKTLPAWKEGYLDIHAINTGRGESSLLIFPDGTTMLIDAAGSLIKQDNAIPPPPQKPNNSVTSGSTVANYASHFIKAASNRLNYMMVSHFDPDHMGSFEPILPTHTTGNFKLTGITEVGAKIPFDKMLDRGYPNYDFPSDMKADERMANYIKFIDWSKTAYHAKTEQFAVGKTDQIVLMRNPSKYKNFQVRNIIANGVVWTGKGTTVANMLPPAAEVVAGKAQENIFCIGFELSYGKFDYFTAGDLQYNDRSSFAWKDVEAPVAKVVTSVDVMKANHHGTSNTNSDVLLNKLAPQTVVSHVWRDVQPNPATVNRMLDANPDAQLFTTNMTDANKVRMGSLMEKIKGMQGHIVVRVQPGGDQYSVYVLDDNNEAYTVTKVFGPYKSN